MNICLSSSKTTVVHTCAAKHKEHLSNLEARLGHCVGDETLKLCSAHRLIFCPQCVTTLEDIQLHLEVDSELFMSAVNGLLSTSNLLFWASKSANRCVKSSMPTTLQLEKMAACSCIIWQCGKYGSSHPVASTSPTGTIWF